MSTLLRIFRRPDYNSEVTQFIDLLKSQKPELESEQRAGRALLWDKRIDRDQQDEYRQGQVRQKAYVYGSESE